MGNSRRTRVYPPLTQSSLIMVGVLGLKTWSKSMGEKKGIFKYFLSSLHNLLFTFFSMAEVMLLLWLLYGVPTLLVLCIIYVFSLYYIFYLFFAYLIGPSSGLVQLFVALNPLQLRPPPVRALIKYLTATFYTSLLLRVNLTSLWETKRETATGFLKY